jgi:hypothetical protein
MSHASIDRDARLTRWQAKAQGRPSEVARVRKEHRTQPYRRFDLHTNKQCVEYKALKLVEQLMAGPGTDAMPFIIALQVKAMDGFRVWSDQELIIEWWRVFNLEPRHDGEEEVASRGTDWDRFEDEHMEEAALHTRLAALTRVLRERNIDPKAYAPGGARIIR